MKKSKIISSFAIVLLSMVIAFGGILVSGVATADNYTPSVESKAEPEIVPPAPRPGAGGIEFVAEILDEEEELQKGLRHDDTKIEIEVVAYAKIGEGTATPEVDKILTVAYDDLNTLPAMTDLVEELNERAKEYSTEYSAKNFVVTDLFDIWINEESEEYLKVEENYLRMTFKVPLTVDEVPPVVIYKCDGDANWSTVPSDKVTNNGNGTMTVDFYRLCPIAFLYSTDTPSDIWGTDEPAPCKGCYVGWHKWVIAILAVVCVLLIVFVVYLLIILKKNNIDLAGRQHHSTPEKKVE